MSEGWVKIYRKTLDSRVFANSELLKLWTLCLLRANHKENWVHIDGISEPIKVSPGQFITGRYSLHQAYYPNKSNNTKSPKTLWRWLEKLEGWGNLSIKTTNKYSIVEITNWDYYQSNEIDVQQNDQQMSNGCPTGDQQVSTNKNDKNVKNEKKYSYGDSEKWDEDKNQPIDYLSFLDAFNDLYDKQLRVTEEKRKNIRGRLRTFTGKEIKVAWEKRANDEWLNEDGQKYLGNWSASMRNDEKIDRYLNGQENNQPKIHRPVAN